MAAEDPPPPQVEERPEKPTLKTIARRTGLAVATVSRALADAPDLRTDTKALVRRVADELGYVPNRAGLRLRTGRTQVISLVMSTEHDMMNNTARLISSLAGTLRETPFHLNVSYFFPGEDALRSIQHIVEMGLADAVIFNQTQPADPRVAWLMAQRFPFATHGRTHWAGQHAWADFDNRAFGAIAVHKLARAGRRRIVVIAPPLNQNYAQDMVAGVMQAGAETGAEVRVLPDVSSDAASAVVQAGMALALAEGVDGLVCASTNSAMASVAALEAHGLRLGREIDLVAKEAIPFLTLFRREIIAIREDVARAGSVLARAAIRAIREPEALPLQDLEVPQDDQDH
ncbi:LacI family DNA-binding transcriptional regulator [Rubellimicrobium rubrum]|uniref:LacI family DNA-binding transcriptional regulator n=1 Tax=Rubellimicrobium rubrum TaxID=2585369 RepID=A0A5C4MS49_9RHOB|nr:LacI family transcriptional regulator [Rubellimicrobium rubrum]TNC48369.1 LacI family DNA-binding transcriptional regulator [Rubellimicrobium rubrum]